MDGFSFSTEVRIRFAETDAQGVAHHASLVVWLEVARVAYLAAHAGGYQAIRDSGVDALRVWARCSDVRGARFKYEYRVDRAGELVADGYTLHATVDRETYRPIRVPVWLAEAVARAEAPAA
jgi:acyl-CoA thioester hydrolase